ncbi:hypothetical protein L9F63_002297 [Diploptera punctata]|uniref:Adenosine kinase n=1 Tax=Diploptera punctata TaxID=6984 RepID=A0AAD8A2B7_DIPPU|nr:hypothetical protein L9F63_002297 [Diploptera punctata]
MKFILEKYKAPILAAFGNPLLDMCTRITDLNILNTYGLTLNCEKELKEGELKIFADIRNRYEVEYHAGGSAQNTLRIFQWLINSPFYSVFLGGIGEDEEGKMLESLVKNAGVDTRYKYHKNHATGSCLALITGENRCLLANLCAANVYKPQDLEVEENIDILNKVYMIYIESFFISHSYDVALQLLDFCKTRKTPLIFSIGSVYMFNDFARELITLSKNANIVFGNKEEFMELARAMGLNLMNVKSTLLALHSMINKEHEFLDHGFGQYLKQLGKVLVMTDGKNPVLCVYGGINSKPVLVEYAVPEMKVNLVKDTTGAGDSFLAGFLVGMFALNNIKTCLAWGCWTARQVIQLVGCQVPSCQPDNILTIKC